MDRSKVGELMVITGNSHPELADLIAKYYIIKQKIILIYFNMFTFFIFRRLGIKVGAASIYHKTNRETMVDIADSVRGKDVYIIQTGTK